MPRGELIEVQKRQGELSQQLEESKQLRDNKVAELERKYEDLLARHTELFYQFADMIMEKPPKPAKSED